MEPPLPPPPSAVANAHIGYPDSVDSSPRSRNADSWDEPLPPVPGAKLRLMCSYGGHIVPRPHDKSLCYLGGDTRIVVVDRHSSLSDLSARLSRSLLNGRSFTLKYQLPNEDLDSLISVTTDEDLENMIEEYDRTSASSLKPSRLRLFLFPSKPDSASSIGSLLDDSKSENWFVEALNGAGILPRGLSSDSTSVNCLLGLDGVHADSSVDVEAQIEALGGNKQVKPGQDVQSVPDSPMLETNSSFGSTSSSPSVSNLPPIRVHVEDGGAQFQDQKVGLEDHFSQMTINMQKQDEGFAALSSPPPPLPTTITATTIPSAVSNNSTVAAGEYQNRVVSDDERSDHGTPGGFRRPTQPPTPTQLQQKTNGGVDLPSPDSVARDNYIANAMSRPKPVFYQEPPVQSRDNRISPNPPVDPKSNFSDPSYRIQMQQVQDSGYALPSQLDQHQQQQQQQSQQQQFIHAGTHYIHHPATGPVPISSFYPMYPPPHPQQHHQQLDQHYPMYFLPVRQTQHYGLPVQSNLADSPAIPASRPPPPPSPAIIPTPAAYKEPAAPVYPTRPVPPLKPELAASMYRTAAAPAPPPLIHIPSDQHQQQYVGYHQMHHPSQSIAVAAAGTGNYAYEFADPAHAQIYYTQPTGATLPPQYQTITSATGVVVSESSAQLPTESSKQQQIRTSQPL
ncbi:PREDICTED: leucine-rich repeat extensin-like protein 5 [Nelumbo nucifera]|uniref:PB1 domain-containing protein n=2 Tax=Nelumbo nucifera TaxID=4432 RepID=A0A822YMP2_NELNU|nr:PREDICTED: leucine-rich repeat extensin-like protein 5 [Nelumbo nucifera]DAD35444.1 TPA_asm: hypothetical protein HUJ06_006084 [Nelumbo nucifera]